MRRNKNCRMNRHYKCMNNVATKTGTVEAASGDRTIREEEY